MAISSGRDPSFNSYCYYSIAVEPSPTATSSNLLSILIVITMDMYFKLRALQRQLSILIVITLLAIAFQHILLECLSILIVITTLAIRHPLRRNIYLFQFLLLLLLLRLIGMIYMLDTFNSYCYYSDFEVEHKQH